MRSLENLYELCLSEHYKKNDHHPEFFANPDRDMPLDARVELTCDLLSCAMGTFKKNNIPISLSICRSIIESQKWPNWKYAVLENLPLSSSNTISIPRRWKKFPNDEKLHLNVLYEIYRSSNRSDVIQQELEKLDCVKFYLEDLDYHKKCIYEIWKEIPEFHTPELEKRILTHDNDKLETLMILGYTAQFCF